MEIKVADKRLGKCIIVTNKDIGKAEEYAIKSLCMLQLICMNKDEDPQKFYELVKIIGEAVTKIEELYNEKPKFRTELFDY